MSAAARVDAEAIRCGPFCTATAIGRKKFQKPLVFGGVLSPISSAAGRNGAAGGAEPRGRGRTPLLCGCPEFYSFRGPAGRTCTCRRWRQVRDLIIAQTEGRPLLSACPVSGSEGRRRGDSLRDLFAPQLQSDERNSKNHWFLAAFLHPFAAVGKRVSRRSAKYPFGERTRSGPSGTPAPTSARRGAQRKKRARGRGALPAGDRYRAQAAAKKL